MFEIANAWALAFLAPLAWLAWRLRRAPRRDAVPYPPTAPAAATTGSWRTRMAAATPALYLLGAALAVLALARPQTWRQWSWRRIEAVSIELVLDTSGSMREPIAGRPGAAAGAAGTRLDAAREACLQLIARRPHDLLGLITFAGYAATQTPLSADHRPLAECVRSAEAASESATPSGRIANVDELLTAIGDAVGIACARLRTAPTSTRIVVLLSDGGADAGAITADEAAAAARRLGIRVYAVHAGAEAPAAPAAAEAPGGPPGPAGPGSALLRRLAEETGGRYYPAPTAEHLRAALDAIDRLERVPVRVRVRRSAAEWYPALLWPALALVAAAATLGFQVRGRAP